MEKLRAVLDLHLKHGSTLGYGLLTLLTAGGERIFSAAVFQCPCTAAWNLPYGLVFLLVPALVLFVLGYVLSARTWRLLTGCCAPGDCSRGSGLRGAGVCAQLSGAAALGRRLCRGRAANCTAQLPLVPCGQATASGVQDLLKEIKAQSQVLGWILIAAVVIFFLIFTSITQCLSPVSFLQQKFWKIYLQQEEQILKSQATEHATKLAKENVKCFFDGCHPKKCNTPSIKDWQQISSLYTFNRNNLYYSMLHKYVSRNERSHGISSCEGDAMIPVLGFVDSLAINSNVELYDLTNT
ncbi:PREDICTED: protein FAM26F [Galeopterus variegatus]|uniref:Protein FAM26F n=1 Tax=Galeopterus variegatus TaxID=482537 RepID=A0ABM0QC87_GALVR|nr:PREDICTED: protein FAM26F [Galeopterus variegatus]